MNNLESDLKAARLRANAWAIGDIEALRQQAVADTTTALKMPARLSRRGSNSR